MSKKVVLMFLFLSFQIAPVFAAWRWDWDPDSVFMDSYTRNTRSSRMARREVKLEKNIKI